MRTILGILCLVVCASCSTVMKQDPPKITPFLAHGNEMKNDPGLPFALVWLADPPSQIRELAAHYRKVMVAPVNLDYLGQGEPESWKKNLTGPADREDAEKIANDLRDRLVGAIKKDPNLGLQVVDAPGPDTFIIEPALVELRPTQAVLNAAETAAGFSRHSTLARTALRPCPARGTRYSASTCGLKTTVRVWGTSRQFTHVPQAGQKIHPAWSG